MGVTVEDALKMCLRGGWERPSLQRDLGHKVFCGGIGKSSNPGAKNLPTGQSPVQVLNDPYLFKKYCCLVNLYLSHSYHGDGGWGKAAAQREGGVQCVDAGLFKVEVVGEWRLFLFEVVRN